MIDSDVFNICDRIKEVDPNLYIVVADPPREDGKNFIVMEHAADGDMLVKRYAELDARVITDLQYMIKIPFAERMRKLEAENDKWEKEQKENELDALYEKMGGPMLTQLHKDGFIEHRPTSYPKKGVVMNGKG